MIANSGSQDGTPAKHAKATGAATTSPRATLPATKSPSGTSTTTGNTAPSPGSDTLSGHGGGVQALSTFSPLTVALDLDETLVHCRLANNPSNLAVDTAKRFFGGVLFS